MKKNIQTLLLFLIMFCTATLAANAEEYIVNTADDFLDKATNHPTAYIKLAADINLAKIGTISKKFQGTIDGEGVDANGNTIYYSLGISGDKNRTYHPIFEQLEGATLKNLIIQNFRIEYDDDDIGAVARTAKNTKFNQVIIADISIFNDDDEAGAIVGKAENCDFRRVKAMGNDVTVDGNRAGGFVGISYNSVYSDCSNSAYSTVYADGSWGNAYAGGFVGESSSDQFVFCVNFATIGALDDRVGGLVGYSTSSYFTNCSNSGFVMHCEEKDFLSYTKEIKANITKNFNKYLTDIQEDLNKHYEEQSFDLSVGFVSFIGTLGLMTASFSVELCLLSVTAATIGGFTVTIIIAAVGIVVSLINLIGAEIGAHDEIGGICGSCQSGVFDACSNYGTILCRDSYAGGIVGLMRDFTPRSKIVNCLNAGEIQGFVDAGGIFGEAHPADEINHCLNVGEIKVKNPEDADPIGNLSINGMGHSMSKNYYKANSAYVSNDARRPVTETELADGTVAGLLNDGATSENAPWRQNIGTDKYPVLDPSHSPADPQKHDDVFVISSVDDLDALRTAVNSGTKERYLVYISEDIDCSTVTWTPIGTYEHPFAGLCDGKGHTINNLYTAQDKTRNGVGFFGIVGINTEVRNLNIGTGEIYGGNGVGAIIGYAEHKAQEEGYIRIIGCGNEANINANYDSGGLIGAIYSNSLMKLTIDNCCNRGNINATEKSAALCGFGKENALVTSCYNSGKVTGYVNGMGFVRTDPNAKLEIHNCYNINDYPELLQTDRDISSFTAQEAKNGTLCYNLNGKSNDTSVGLMWEQDITSTDPYPHYIGYTKGYGVYTSRAITATYGTVVLPYTVASNNNIKYYTISDNQPVAESSLHFQAVQTLPAGTPALFRVVKEGTYKFISTDYLFTQKLNPVQSGAWTMTGNLYINQNNIVFTDPNQLATLYYVSGDQIKSATNKLTVTPFRAYLIGPSRTSSAAPAIDVVFDDDPVPTGIQLNQPIADCLNEGIYTLSGQRIAHPQRGVNIIKGRKIIIR